MIHKILPVAKPRQTRSDKWKQRPAVMRYRAFADEVRLKRVQLPEAGAWIIFHMPMPVSWSQTKRALMKGKAHQQKPDVDNLTKSILDSIHADDSGVWDIRATKIWADEGGIEIREMEFYT